MMLRILFPTLTICCLSGCFSQKVEYQVTTYLSQEFPFPQASTGARIAVMAQTLPRETLLEQEFQKKIEVLIRKHGYEVTDVVQATHVMFAVASIDSGRTAQGVAPIYRPGGTATSYSYGTYGWSTTTTQLPGSTDYVPYSYTFFTRNLTLQLVQKDRWLTGGEKGLDIATVWKATTVSAGRSADLREIIDYLLLGTLPLFGKDTGKDVNGRLAMNGKEVKQFRAEVAVAPSSPNSQPAADVATRQDRASRPPLTTPTQVIVIPPAQDAFADSPSSGSVIESKVEGDFEGFDGSTVLKLDNGTIWEQADYYIHFHYAYRPNVIAFRSNGVWKLQVEGVPKPVRVNRLK